MPNLAFFDDPVDALFESQPSAQAPVEFADDPVAMACASYRAFVEHRHRWATLSAAAIQPQDREQAQHHAQHARRRGSGHGNPRCRPAPGTRGLGNDHRSDRH